MSFCDSLDLEKIAGVLIRDRSVPSEFGCSVLQESLGATPLN